MHPKSTRAKDGEKPLNRSAQNQRLETSENSYRYLKIGIWAFILLLIFEGALRKWVLPGLAAPLLVVRDPIAFWLLYATWRKGLLPFTPYLFGMIVIGVIGIITALLLGHGNLVVTIFGARILLLHFPLMFVIGAVFNQEDVIEVGKMMVWIALPMAILIALQFYSPQSAWVNRGVGGDMEGSGFSGALGYFRSSGTFSFTNGVGLFFSLLACYVFYFWLNQNLISRIPLILATVALLAAIPLSISRTLFFQVGVSLIFTLFAIFRKPQYLGKIVGAGICAVVLMAVLSQTEFIKTATEAFTSRFESASKIEGGVEGTLVDRYLGGMIKPLLGASKQPFFGYGIGMGTNAGSQLLVGERAFLIAEGEWSRLIGELGFFMGMGVIFIRLGFCMKLASSSLRKLHQGVLLPWILLSFCLLTIPQGQWAQPTALGFSTLIGGLMIASMKCTPRQFFYPLHEN